MPRNLLAGIAGLLVMSLAVSACGDSHADTEFAATPSPVAGFEMSESDALDAALNASSYMIQDSEVSSTSADAMRWDQALGVVGGPAAVERDGGTRVWLVTLVGVFMPPPGPVQYDDTPPDVPIWSEVRTIIDDSTGESLLLTYRPTDRCPDGVRCPPPNPPR